jgi:hypothetical protein
MTLDGPRLYEYRTLDLPGWAFPVCGSNMAQDAQCRDLTINSVYYDPVRHLVVDPVGGLAHLKAEPRKMVSALRTADQVKQAGAVLRMIKFVVRWSRDRLDLTGVRQWLATLPDGWIERLDAGCWAKLAKDRDKYAKDVDLAAEQAAAAELGHAATTLLEKLLERGA